MSSNEDLFEKIVEYMEDKMSSNEEMFKKVVEYMEDKIMKRIDDSKRDLVDQLTSKFDDFARKQEEIEHRQGVLEEITSEVTTELVDMRKEVSNLQQKQLSDTILIKGIPEVEKDLDDLQGLVNSVFSALKVNDSVIGAFKAFRFGKKEKKEKDGKVTKLIRPIEVQLSTKQIKNIVMKAKKTEEFLDLNCSKINHNGVPLGKAEEKVYLDQKLTSTYASLYASARALRKDGKLKHVWISDGDILVRKGDNTRYIKIESEEQLKMLEKEDSEPVQQSAETPRKSLEKFFNEKRRQRGIVEEKRTLRSDKRKANSDLLNKANKQSKTAEQMDQF